MENHTPQEPNSNEKDNMERSGWKIYLTHPTNLPMTIAILYFIAVGIIATLYSPLGNDRSIKTFALLFFPSFFLFGLSGFLNIIRKESVRLRYIHRDSTAYLDGLKKIIVGWGGCVYMLYIIIFK